MKKQVLKVGIMPEAQIRARMMAIARGEYKPARDEPKTWFSSMKSLAEIISEHNQQLLVVLHEKQPGSLAELSALTGRAVSNLSRTLHTLERYGIVELERQGRKIAPKAKVTEFQVVVDVRTRSFANRIIEGKT